MTFDEISLKRRPCSFLSNIVKKWCQYYNAFMSCFRHRHQERKKRKHPPVKTYKHSQTVMRRGGGEHNYDNYLQQSKMWDQQSSWESAGPSESEHKSRLTRVSSVSRLPWGISGNIWLFNPHAPPDAISVPPQQSAHFKLYTHTCGTHFCC